MKESEGKERLYTIEDLESLLDSIPYEVWMKDDSGRHIYVNRLSCEKIGLKKEEIIGKTDYEFRNFDMAKRCYETDRDIIGKNVSRYYEERVETDDEDIWYEVNKFSIDRNNGKEVLLGGMAKEVSINRNIKVEVEKMISNNHEIYEGFQKYIDYLNKVVNNLRKILRCESINIFRYNEKDKLFTPYLKSSNNENVFLDGINLNIDSSLVNELVSNNFNESFKESIDNELKQYYKEEYRNMEIYQFDILPITFANEMIGIIHIYSKNSCNVNNTSFLSDMLSSISNIIYLIEVSSDIKEEFVEYTSRINVLNIEKEGLEKIMSLEKSKVDFLTNVSHEFKTPINIILAATKLILNILDMDSGSEASKDKIRNYTNIINQNTYRILRLVNNVLDNSQINDGFYSLNIKNYNIVRVIEDIVMSTVEYIDSNDKEIIFDTDEEEVVIGCDADKIERIMLNLISNSLKFIGENGKIEVEIRNDYKEKKVFVHLRNNGPAILKEDAELIFNKFVQADELLTRRSEGCGIGLYLVRSFVEMHGGKVWVNTDVEEGVEFIFYLPMEKVHTKEVVENKENDNDYRIEKCRIEFSDIYFI